MRLDAFHGFRQLVRTLLRSDLHTQSQLLIDQIDAWIVRCRLIRTDEVPAMNGVQQSRYEVFRVDIRVREVQWAARPNEC
jgi:hypothetical protein